MGAAEYYMCLEVDFPGMVILPFLASLKSHVTFIACHLRPCFFTTESTSHWAHFMSQINSSFGSRGMTLALNDVQFSALIQHLKGKQKSLLIKKAACTIGLQPCGKIWVFAGDVQVWVGSYPCRFNASSFPIYVDG